MWAKAPSTLSRVMLKIAYDRSEFRSCLSVRVTGCKQQKLTKATLRRNGTNWQDTGGSLSDRHLKTRHKLWKVGGCAASLQKE